MKRIIIPFGGTMEDAVEIETPEWYDKIMEESEKAIKNTNYIEGRKEGRKQCLKKNVLISFLVE